MNPFIMNSLYIKTDKIIYNSIAVITTTLLQSFRHLLPNQIQRTPFPEPCDLIFAQSVSCGDLYYPAILLGDLQHDVSVGCKVPQADRLNKVSASNQLVVGLVRKGEWEDSLFLEVGLVDTRKGSRDNERAAQIANLEGRMLAR